MSAVEKTRRSGRHSPSLAIGLENKFRVKYSIYSSHLIPDYCRSVHTKKFVCFRIRMKQILKECFGKGIPFGCEESLTGCHTGNELLDQLELLFSSGSTGTTLVATVGRMPPTPRSHPHWRNTGWANRLMKNESKHEAMPTIKSKPIRRIGICMESIIEYWLASGRTRHADREPVHSHPKRMINDVLIEVQLDRKQKNLRPSPLWSYFLIASDTKLIFLSIRVSNEPLDWNQFTPKDIFCAIFMFAIMIWQTFFSIDCLMSATDRQSCRSWLRLCSMSQKI